MAGMIPQDFIDDLLSRTDIVDVIGEFVQLRKGGKDYQGLCPFHNEKTPSFTVSQVKQFYHCFGCGANGSAISFMMDHNHLDFVETIKDLASKAGMQLPENTETKQNRPDHNPVFNILEQASQFYAKQLRQHSSKERAVEYLKNRGLSGEIAAAYDIGYAPPGWDNLINSFGMKEQITSDQISLLLKAGLIAEKELEDNKKRHYDRFRDRIMFPIRDYKGRVIGFGGRVFDQGEPKYLNSPETPVFHKGRELYGLFEARKRCRDLSRIIVVEGYMDVVALAQFGINNAVATLGTATTIEHLQRLFKATREIVICFDGDKAGQRAAWKALELSLPLLKEGYSVRFLFLPEGDDPDSIVRKQGAAYFENTENYTQLSEFLFDSLVQQTDLTTLEGRARLFDLASPLIAKIPTGALRTLMQQQLSSLSQLASEKIDQMMPIHNPAPERIKPVQRRPVNRNKRFSRTLVEQAIHILINHPEFVIEIDFPKELSNLDDQNIPFILELTQQISDQSLINTGQLLEHFRESEKIELLNQLLPGEKDLPDDAMRAEYRGIIQTLQKNLAKQQRSALIQTSDGKITDQIKSLYTRSSKGADTDQK
ncbi:MAG: DNA primase [Gammaproteobacteria bacterium]